MKFGVALHPGTPFTEIVRDAQVAERHGFNHVVVPDYKLLKDVYCTLTLIASSTSTVKLGPCTTNPYTRHPAVTAAAIASLNEISGGRAVLVLAQGGLATTRPLDISRASSQRALRDAVAIIRGLWKNEAVTHSGVIRTRNAKLEFEASKSPIYMAGTGPTMLELSGELADGVLVNIGIADEQLEFALRHFETGLERARNPPSRPYKACWMLGCSVYQSREEALNAAKPHIALLLANLPDELMKISRVDPSVRDKIKALYYSVGAYRAAELVTDSMVGRFTVAGTPRDAVREFERLSSHGFDEVWLLPPGEEDKKSRKDVIETIGKEIIPSFS